MIGRPDDVGQRQQADRASIAVDDANGDGKPDVIVANFCASSGSNLCFGRGVAGVLLGKGDGTFEPTMAYDTGGFGGLSIAGADLNGDGNVDLLDFPVLDANINNGVFSFHP